MIKENKSNLKNELIVNKIEDFYILNEELNSDFMKLFGFNIEKNSKIIFINKNSEISLILEE